MLVNVNDRSFKQRLIYEIIVFAFANNKLRLEVTNFLMSKLEVKYLWRGSGNIQYISLPHPRIGRSWFKALFIRRVFDLPTLIQLVLLVKLSFLKAKLFYN